MPSTEHDAIAELFAQRPDLAPALLQRLGCPLPAFSSIAIAPAAFSQKMAVEYRADLVLLLRQGRRRVQAVVIEVQRAIEKSKLWTWPMYQTAARARHRCNAVVLVVCLDRDVADWAQRLVLLGGRSVFGAEVLGPGQIPRVTSGKEARETPELSVLSALAHGADEGGAAVVRTMLKTAARLDDEAGRFYTDLVLARAGDVARKILEAMMMKGYEFQSDFAKKYYGLGKAEGEAKGKAEAVLAVLEARGLKVSKAQRASIAGCSEAGQLDAWLRQVVTVSRASELTGLAPAPQKPARGALAARSAPAKARRAAR